jgi:hypothetical protein
VRFQSAKVRIGGQNRKIRSDSTYQSDNSDLMAG